MYSVNLGSSVVLGPSADLSKLHAQQHDAGRNRLGERTLTDGVARRGP